MNNSELSKYILHYIREDRTRSAIMLTADWGTGKSYYIQNELIPFLGKEENSCCTCIVVSLYGLKSVEENYICFEKIFELPTFGYTKQYHADSK